MKNSYRSWLLVFVAYYDGVCVCYPLSLSLCRIGLEGRVIYDFCYIVLNLQMLIMSYKKLYVLITYMVMGPEAL